MNKYLSDSLTYTDNGNLITTNGNLVMMEWEDDIMRESAKVVCENGGRVLNIGFGMGIIDTYIQTHSIKEHWIIEAHPDVLKYMKQNGWYDKPNVTIIENTWQNVLHTLPTFDGIYFDTYAESDFYRLLVPHLGQILNKDGIFCFYGDFHNNSFNTINDKFTKMGMNVSSKNIKLKNIPSLEEYGVTYWPHKQLDYKILRIQNIINIKRRRTLF